MSPIADGNDYDVAGRAKFAIRKLGGLTATALALGLGSSKRVRIFHWQKNGIPPAMVGRMAALTGLEPHELRPDLFPQSPAKAAE
jgi:hypothetical protein